MPLKTVLITGCSDGGLGAALAKAFQEQGYHVFATLRNTAKAGSLGGEHGTNIDVLPLDTTSKASIDTCLETVRKKTGGKLDVLVNNAGFGTTMPLLHASIEEAKAIYDVNVWGTLSLVQAFSPLLLESKGVIMNICSIVGAANVAWQGKRYACVPKIELSRRRTTDSKTGFRNIQQLQGRGDNDFRVTAPRAGAPRRPRDDNHARPGFDPDLRQHPCLSLARRVAIRENRRNYCKLKQGRTES